MKIQVKNFEGKKVRQLDLPEAVFAYPYKEHLIHLAVQSYLSSIRSGTHQTKTRNAVRGSGRKPYRQKGTGRARAGSAKSPLWRSGGTVHGPQPRSYKDDLSAREKRNALKSALSRKLRDQGITVLESLEVGSHKTGALAARLAALGIEGKALLVDQFDNSDLLLAVRNNPRLKAVDALAVNVYDIVDRPQIVVSEQALGRLTEVLSK